METLTSSLWPIQVSLLTQDEIMAEGDLISDSPGVNQHQVRGCDCRESV